MPHQWFELDKPLSTRAFRMVGTCDYHPNKAKTEDVTKQMVARLKKHGLQAKVEWDSYGTTHHYSKIYAKDTPLKKFKGVAWVHPKGGGDDYSINITVSAPSLAEAKKDVRKHLIQKYHTHEKMADDFSIKEVKR